MSFSKPGACYQPAQDAVTLTLHCPAPVSQHCSPSLGAHTFQGEVIRSSKDRTVPPELPEAAAIPERACSQYASEAQPSRGLSPHKSCSAMAYDSQI